jgi:hypothetical protein
MRSAFVTGFALFWALEVSAQNPATLSIEQLKSGIENQHLRILHPCGEAVCSWQKG